MRIFTKGTLRKFWEKHNDAEIPLKTWYKIVEKAKWKNPQDVKKVYSKASIIGDNRVVFNIKGNDYRLVVFIIYELQRVYVCFIGTHKEYDKINVKTITL
ncbi:MAG: type II toxin-antitoxin system HigB family toxin [Bacteroidota bacterium]